MKKCKLMLNSVLILYTVFILVSINIGYFFYNNDHQSIFIFSMCCLISYFINKNMIIVLGISIAIVDTISIIRHIKFKEGFDEDEEDEGFIEENNETSNDTETSTKNKPDNDSETESFDTDYVYDKNIIKELKPKVLKSLNKLNSVNINEINQYINSLRNIIDP